MIFLFYLHLNHDIFPVISFPVTETDGHLPGIFCKEKYFRSHYALDYFSPLWWYFEVLVTDGTDPEWAIPPQKLQSVSSWFLSSTANTIDYLSLTKSHCNFVSW